MSFTRRTFAQALGALFLSACAMPPPPPAAAPPAQPPGSRKLRIRVVKVKWQEKNDTLAGRLPDTLLDDVRASTIKALTETGYTANAGGTTADCLARITLQAFAGWPNPGVEMKLTVTAKGQTITEHDFSDTGQDLEAMANNLAVQVAAHFVSSPEVTALTKRVADAARDDEEEDDDEAAADEAPKKKPKKKKKKAEPEED